MRSSSIAFPNRNEGRDLYPINPTDAENFVSALCPVVDLSIREGVAQLTLGMVRGLNFLTGVGWSDRPISPRVVHLLSEPQKRSIYHLFKAAAMFFCVSIPCFDLATEHKSLEERRIAYSGEAVSVRQQLEAALVIPAWPDVGAAAVCLMADSHVAQLFF